MVYYASRLNIFKKNKLDIYHLKHSELSNPMLRVFKRNVSSCKTKVKTKNRKNSKNDEIKNDLNKNLFYTELINLEENTRKRAFSVSNKSLPYKNIHKVCTIKNQIIENIPNNSIDIQKGSFFFNKISEDQISNSRLKSNKYFNPSLKLPSNLKSRLNNFLPRKNNFEQFPKGLNLISNFSDNSIKIHRINMKKIVLSRNKLDSSHKKKEFKYVDLNLSHKDSVFPYKSTSKNDVMNIISSSNIKLKDTLRYCSIKRNEFKMFKLNKTNKMKLLTYTIR